MPPNGDDGILNDECIERKPSDKNLTTDSEPVDEKQTASLYLFKDADEIDSQDFEYLCLTDPKRSQQDEDSDVGQPVFPKVSSFDTT